MTGTLLCSASGRILFSIYAGKNSKSMQTCCMHHWVEPATETSQDSTDRVCWFSPRFWFLLINWGANPLRQHKLHVRLVSHPSAKRVNAYNEDCWCFGQSKDNTMVQCLLIIDNYCRSSLVYLMPHQCPLSCSQWGRVLGNTAKHDKQKYEIHWNLHNVYRIVPVCDRLR